MADTSCLIVIHGFVNQLGLLDKLSPLILFDILQTS